MNRGSQRGTPVLSGGPLLLGYEYDAASYSWVNSHMQPRGSLDLHCLFLYSEASPCNLSTHRWAPPNDPMRDAAEERARHHAAWVLANEPVTRRTP